MLNRNRAAKFEQSTFTLSELLFVMAIFVALGAIVVLGAGSATV